MSVLSGTLSVRRYRVLSVAPDNFRDSFTQAVRVHTLVPLDPQKNATEDRAVGWCSVHDPNDLDLSFDKFWLDGRIVLSLRVDVIRPAPAEVKRLVAQKQEQEEARRKSPLPRAALKALKEQVIAELRLRTPPQVRTTDMVWHLDLRRVYFFSHSKAPNEALVDLFQQTFGLSLDIEGPSAWAMDLATTAAMDQQLKEARPTAALLGGFSGIRPDVKNIDELSRMARN